MLPDDSHTDIDRFARTLIRHKVSQLIGRAGFTDQDRDDLEQELVLKFLRRLPSFDPKRGHRNIFVTMVVEGSIANILRARRAKKRDYRRVNSLNVTIKNDEGGLTELADTLGQREHNARRGRYPRSNEELAQLAKDMAELLANLPSELRDLAQRLKSQSISEVARETGVPRTTLNDSVRRLRRRFERAGLKGYL